MDAKLAIKYDYLIGREDPSQVFDAMSLYIQSYRDFAGLMSEAIGIREEFIFKLDEVERGSIKSIVSALGSACGSFEKCIYQQGNKLFKDLMDIGDTKSEEQVNQLAENLESRLSQAMPEEIAEPYVDRKRLAIIIKSFSEANELTKDGETVSVLAGNDENYEELVNQRWIFSGNIEDMFLGERTKVDTVMKMHAVTTVCEGNSAWMFKSVDLKGRRFQANILDRNWLKKYQSGMIPPIGPMDVIIARVEYTVLDMNKNKGAAEIKNAKIKKMRILKRHKGYQYGF